MEQDEQALISRCLEGDEAAFRDLFRTHVGRVKAYLRRSGFSAADSDDLTQRVFLSVCKSLKTFDPSRGAFAGWLGAVARNIVRRQWQRRAQPESYDPEIAEDVFVAYENPRETVDGREEIDTLRQCIEGLPEELALVVQMRYTAALTTRGIADVIGMSEATVRLRIKEAKGLLERCLKDKGFTD